MARPWSRKRAERAEIVRLTGEEHEWWARQKVTQAWTPRRTPEEQAEEDQRDILAEHFGDDWRTSFGLTPATVIDLDEVGPYQVLGVDPTASWDEVVEAHRDMARRHHPDRLSGQSEDERAEGEEQIRVINLAYEELQIRRGR